MTVRRSSRCSPNERARTFQGPTFGDLDSKKVAWDRPPKKYKVFFSVNENGKYRVPENQITGEKFDNR